MTIRRRGFGVLLLGIALMSCISSCDLFRTRDPEPPKGGSATFVPPTSPEIVLENLRSAIEEKNVTNYLRCLLDTMTAARTYRFFPTAAAASRYSATFATWSLQSEKSWFSSLVALTPANASSSLALTGGFAVMAADSAIYNGDYLLTFQHGVPGVPEAVRGALQVVLLLDRNSFWSILEWTDNPIGSDPGWSELKGRFAN